MLYFIALFFLAVSASFAAVIPRDESSAANAYSGNSGPANGGNSTASGFQLISLFSNNGGDGGNTPTGESFAQSGGSSTPREDTKRQRDSKAAKPNPASLPALFV
ncbi:hypothetical protein ARMGADRAFT_1006952 [Armillaria gallica]|uniref:Uncharacterized protein n=1 Tax=Armillaria gallica TaxID=47427 RepID=A0A2H3EIM5_ARMGA|nr:hypothetical protein ARMGADRAFT_1006952 [Armillaria gallica]